MQKQVDCFNDGSDIRRFGTPRELRLRAASASRLVLQRKPSERNLLYG
jgi:hypothetical protein